MTFLYSKYNGYQSLVRRLKNYMSTKEKIIKTGFLLFAKNGYAGTSMNDIAKVIGINKASLYSHYSSKEEIFLSVYETVAKDYESLYVKLIEDSCHLKTEARLQYIFRNYVLHFYQNPDLQSFWNQLNYYTPQDIHEKYYNDISERNKKFSDKMEEIFADAMKKGVLRKSNSEKMYISFWAMCEGALSIMLAIKNTDESWIDNFWTDIWLGLKGGKVK